MKKKNKNTLTVLIVALVIAFFLFRPNEKVIAVGFSTIGVLIFFGGIFHFIWARASTHWPKTSGIIRRSEVVKTRSSRSNSGRKTSYNFEVEYEYEVNGKIYANDKYSYRVNYNAAYKKGAHELTLKYPVEALVDVYYDPKKPGRSVLLPGINYGSYLPILGGLIFSCVGYAIYFGKM